MRIVYGADAQVAEWVSQRVGYRIWPPFVAIGATDDDRTYCCGAVFNNWNGANIEMTLALDTTPTRGAIRALLDYVFVQIKATRLSIHTRRSNVKVRHLAPKFGFQFEGIAKQYFGPTKADDGFCYVLFPGKSKFQ